jgi:RHS repeat-associated protein
LETQYVYDAGGNLLAEANSAGQVLRYYIYGAGLTATVKGNTYYVYHHDGTGHTVALTNASNEVINRYAYSPYGELLGQQESFTQPFKYAGQVGIFTESENLYYMRARYYDAEVGRFISEDPAGFVDGPNLYAYVGGNPIMAVDPTGLITWSGTATTLSATGPVGASLTRYKLTSEMVGGKAASVVITAVGPSIGYGANIGGTHSQIAFEDSRSQIDTSVFNGRYRAIQIGSTIPFGPGYGAYAIEMGDATSVDHGRIDIGYDSSISGTIGSSTVTSTTWISGK